MDKQVLEDFIAKGYTITQIGKELKLHRGTVTRWLRKLGMSPISRKLFGNCKHCGKELTGSQRFYCSAACKIAEWNNQKEGGTKRHTLKGRERKQLLIDLKGGKCEKCGYDRCLGALSFHHLDPEEKRLSLDVRTIRGTAIEKLIEEVKKCRLLCANCHAEEHWNE